MPKLYYLIRKHKYIPYCIV